MAPLSNIGCKGLLKPNKGFNGLPGGSTQGLFPFGVKDLADGFLVGLGTSCVWVGGGLCTIGVSSSWSKGFGLPCVVMGEAGAGRRPEEVTITLSNSGSISRKVSRKDWSSSVRPFEVET